MYCGCFDLLCNVWVCMCGFCNVWVLRYFYLLRFVLFVLCFYIVSFMYILICFVCASVRTTATE